MEAARVIYSAGFFITVSPESMLLMAQHACANDKTVSVSPRVERMVWLRVWVGLRGKT